MAASATHDQQSSGTKQPPGSLPDAEVPAAYTSTKYRVLDNYANQSVMSNGGIEGKVRTKMARVPQPNGTPASTGTIQWTSFPGAQAHLWESV